MSTKRWRDRTLEDVFGEPGPRAYTILAMACPVTATALLAVAWQLWGAFIRHHAGCP